MPQAPQRTIGLDVGGANLKAADGLGAAVTVPFPLWEQPGSLPERVADLLGRFGAADRIALTMTGELADCFADKEEGVRAIVDAVESVARAASLRVATVDDRWLTPEQARQAPRLAAAANWRVLARWVARQAGVGPTLLVDAGSTTVDLIPIAKGRVATDSTTDTLRLLAGELVYTGLRRTPVCAVVDRLPYRGAECPVAGEWFATTADAWLLMGELPESDHTDTADGRPFRRAESIARLGRCLCADGDEFDERDALAAAKAVTDAQAELLVNAIRRAKAVPQRVVLSGEGERLARRAARAAFPDAAITSLADLAGAGASACGPAHAAASLLGSETSP